MTMGGRGASSSMGGGIGQPNDATEYYVSGEGMWINDYLRGRGDFGSLSDSEKAYLADLDRATGGTVTEDKLYRSVDAQAIFGNMSDSDFDDLSSYILYGKDSFGKGAEADRIKSKAESKIDNALGKTQTEKGFMSTTTDRGVAEEWGDFTGSSKPVVLEISTGGKAKGVNLSSYDKNVSSADAQHEVLLARGQSYKVDNISAKDGNIVVEVSLKK